MNIELKTKFFDIISSLGYKVVDNPYSQQNKPHSFPLLSLRLDNITRDNFRSNFIYNYSFVVDVFSLYDGEKEILEIEEKINDALKDLYTIDGVTYVNQIYCKILDDTSLGSQKKHGVIKYFVKCSGEQKEE